MPHSSRGTPELLAKVKERVDLLRTQHESDDCWPWGETAIRTNWYGRVKVKKTSAEAHRLSHILFVGPIPDGLFVRHTCDFRPCVNPSHLLVGTPKDNSQDAVERNRMSSGNDHYSRTSPERLARGDRHGTRTKPDRLPRGDRHYARTEPERLPRGERHGHAKLTGDQVRKIRRRYAEGARYTDLAREYGVSDGTLSSILRRKTWRHVA